jgi:AcrR family transcriptional regulator
VARPPSTAEEVAVTTAELLTAAQTLLEAGGIDAMSFRAIASRVGCSHSKIYTYFDSKADLVDALRIRSYEVLFDSLSAAAARHDDPIESLHAIAEAYVRLGLKRPQLYGMLYSNDGRMSETAPRLLDAKLAAIGICRDAIATAAAAGALDLVGDPLAAAHLFWAGAHGLVQLELGGFLVVGCTLEDLLPNLIAALVEGLSTPAHPSRRSPA